MRLLSVLSRHRARLLFGLVAAAAATRAALVARCPAAFGYVFDYYHEAVEFFWRTGRLPIAADCWQCYHPPLYYVLGVPLYALGQALGRSAEDPEAWGLHMLAVLPLAASTVAAVYGAKLVRLVVRHRGLSLLGTGIILAFPCLFIGADAPEADIVVTALMSVFLYRLARVSSAPARWGWRDAVILGLLAGLAAATKYTGLIALGTAGGVTALLIVTGGSRRGLPRGLAPRLRFASLGLVVLGVTVAVGGWRYADNQRRYGTALFANGSAGDAFSTNAEYATGTDTTFGRSICRV